MPSSFILSGTAKNIESKLIENKRPVAMSVPGYVLPRDVEAKLFINYPKKIKSIQVQPENALKVSVTGLTKNGLEKLFDKRKHLGKSQIVHYL
jgi:hypothetical protein